MANTKLPYKCRLIYQYINKTFQRFEDINGDTSIKDFKEFYRE